MSELPRLDLLHTVRDQARRAGAQAMLVGGAVRDALQGHAAHDFDFSVLGNTVRVARGVADALRGAFYIMDEARGTCRVIVNERGMRRSP
jgi:tRNA nucleotidyltransferase/poly(A) polymerase